MSWMSRSRSPRVRKPVRRIRDEPHAPLGGQRRGASDGFDGNLGDIDGSPVESEPGRVGRGERQQVGDQPAQPIRLGHDVLDERPPGFLHEVLALDHLGIGPDEGRRVRSSCEASATNRRWASKSADRHERPPSDEQRRGAAPSNPTRPTSDVAAMRLSDWRL